MVASVIDPQVLEERYGVIDSKGNVVLDFQYGPLSLFNNVIVTSIKKGQEWRYGVLNLAYQEVLPFKYSQIKPVNNKYAIVKEGNMNGLIDASGSVIVPPQYHIIELNDREFRGKVYDTYEIRNDQNQMLATHQVKDLRKADKGVLIASGMNETLLLNTKGEVIKSLPSTQVFEVESGKAITRVNGKYGFINLRGETLIPNSNDKIWLSDGYLGIQDSNNNGD